MRPFTSYYNPLAPVRPDKSIKEKKFLPFFKRPSSEFPQAEEKFPMTEIGDLGKFMILVRYLLFGTTGPYNKREFRAMFHILFKQGRIHGYRSRVRVGRGHI